MPEVLARVISADACAGSCVSRDPSGYDKQIAELAELDASVGTERRNDFIRGRIAARRALRELEVQLGTIPIGPWGVPEWPAGVVGSISHSAGAGVAVVAHASDRRGIGIDIEARNRRLSNRSVGRVLTRAESWALEEKSTLPWPLVLFCAKEAAFKAVFQAYGCRLLPSDLAFAQPAVGAASGSLLCGISRPDLHIHVRYALIGRFLVACVELAR